MSYDEGAHFLRFKAPRTRWSVIGAHRVCSRTQRSARQRNRRFSTSGERCRRAARQPFTRWGIHARRINWFGFCQATGVQTLPRHLARTSTILISRNATWLKRPKNPASVTCVGAQPIPGTGSACARRRRRDTTPRREKTIAVAGNTGRRRKTG